MSNKCLLLYNSNALANLRFPSTHVKKALSILYSGMPVTIAIGNDILNPIKTKTMILNPLLKYDVLPLISTERGQVLEVVEEHKILGHMIRSDLKTISNTEYICKRAFKRMWILRRLKSLGCQNVELLEVLQQQIISICEVGVPFWGPMITATESNMLERCLKTGLHIILQDD